MKIRVFLSEEEVKNCAGMGEETVAICREQKAQPRIEEAKERHSRESSNGLGFKGEYAFSKLFKLEPTQVTVRADGGIDYVLSNGLTVDVKCSRRNDPDLIFDGFDSFKADIGVLGHSTDDKYFVDFVGWITKDKFMDICDQRDYGHGMRKYVKFDQLSPILDLVQLHQKGNANGWG